MQLLLSLRLTPFTYHVVLARAAGTAANNVSAATHNSFLDFIFPPARSEDSCYLGDCEEALAVLSRYDGLGSTTGAPVFYKALFDKSAALWLSLKGHGSRSESRRACAMPVRKGNNSGGRARVAMRPRLPI